jgi:hypothetical protein
MPEMKEAVNPRIIAVGSVTGNDNTVGGGGVYPIADLHELEGLAAGMKNVINTCVHQIRFFYFYVFLFIFLSNTHLIGLL